MKSLFTDDIIKESMKKLLEPKSDYIKFLQYKLNKNTTVFYMLAHINGRVYTQSD